VTVTFDDDDDEKITALFVLSVGLYVDAISQGFHSING